MRHRHLALVVLALAVATLLVVARVAWPRVATDPAQAASELEAGRFPLVLLDVSPPDRAGAWTAAGVAQQTPQELYQAALYQEEVQGDLQRAISLYQRILTDGSVDRAVAAKAQLHVGLCYETLGRAEAERAYERVISDYADQAEVVGEARTHLAALRPAVGRGPVARRLLSGDDTDINNLMIVTPSPDGELVAYTHLGSDQALCVRDLATGKERCLASGLPEAMNFSPVWSPDGKRLAFLSAVMTTGSGEIKVVDLGSRAVTAIPGTRTENQHPRSWYRNLTPMDWSRDGRFLLCRTAVGADATDACSSRWPGEIASRWWTASRRRARRHSPRMGGSWRTRPAHPATSRCS